MKNSDILSDLIEWAQDPSDLDYCEMILITEAIQEIVAMRKCIRYVIDAYLNGNQISNGHKELILSEKWYKFAQEFLPNKAVNG